MSMSKYFLGSAVFFALAFGCSMNKLKKAEAERDRHQSNSSALLSTIKRLQVDSTTMAISVKTLHLNNSELALYRSKDLDEIKRLGIKINSLQSMSKHDLSINVPIKAGITKENVIIVNADTVEVSRVKMQDKFVTFDGTIRNDTMTAKIHVPVTLRQAVWAEYKWKFLWFHGKVKAVHQTISSDNPYVEIKFSEYIQIKD